jgi:hypothetical protein
MINVTRYAVKAVPLVEPNGRPVVVAIVKATFEVRSDGKLALAEAQEPVCLSDEPIDPQRPWGSLRRASDLCPFKVGTDIVVWGEAVADKPVTALDVALKVRDVTHPLRVHGPRVYYKGVAGVAISPAAKFERMPIVYELAYGGATDDAFVVERRNPAGRGVAKNAADLVDTPAPQIEHPAHPITSAADRPDPVGFGPIPSHWLPRADRAGTFDDRWCEDRMPLLPVDFDARHYNVAHPSLLAEAPLVAGDVVATLGLTPRGLWRVELPDLGVRLDARYDHGERLSVCPGIDTVVLEPSFGRVTLAGRKAFVKGRGKMKLRELRAQMIAG